MSPAKRSKKSSVGVPFNPEAILKDCIESSSTSNESELESSSSANESEVEPNSGSSFNYLLQVVSHLSKLQNSMKGTIITSARPPSSSAPPFFGYWFYSKQLHSFNWYSLFELPFLLRLLVSFQTAPLLQLTPPLRATTLLQLPSLLHLLSKYLM